MIIGVPKEIKTMENRVAMTPGGVASLTRRGHTVLVEVGAGMGSGLTDAEYEAAGAKLVGAKEAWGAGLVVKVKEPLPSEFGYLNEDCVLFTYLHLAADRDLTDVLLKTKTTSIAYETVRSADGKLPLLVPMSEVAGRMAVQVGAHFLESFQGGRGVLLGGVPGVQPGKVLVLGAGTVGLNAVRVAVGLGARVTVMDHNHGRLELLDNLYRGRVTIMTSNEHNIREVVRTADLVVGAVLVVGGKTPKLITRDMLSTMQPGTVIVDVAVDQGGCVETTHATTHDVPTFVVDGVVHYGVSNMPGAVPRTSTFALTDQTLPYVMRLAAKGMDALREDPGLGLGLNTYGGRITCPAVGDAYGLDACTPTEILA